MSVPFLPLPIETDPDAVTDRILAALTARLPGWIAREGALEVALAEELGREIAATNARTADAAASALAGIGESVHGLAPILGAAATLEVDLVVVPGGGIVPADLTVTAISPTGVDVAYRLGADLRYGPGELYPRAVLTATDVGDDANGTPTELALITATSTVTAVAPRGPASGGVDPETREAYLGRLTDYLSLLRPGGVRATDLAILARSTAGVWRALAIDLYDAESGNAASPKTVSLFPVAADGTAIGTSAKAALRSAIEAVREVGLLVRIADPTYTSVDVMVTVGAEDGADPDGVRAGVEAAVRAYLDPASWGSSPSDPRAFTATPRVRYTEVIRAAGSADGVLFVDQVTLDGTEADITLPGRAPLPAPTTGPDPTVITVVVTS